jgi:hypothetical protein
MKRECIATYFRHRHPAGFRLILQRGSHSVRQANCYALHTRILAYVHTSATGISSGTLADSNHGLVARP